MRFLIELTGDHLVHWILKDACAIAAVARAVWAMRHALAGFGIIKCRCLYCDA